MSFESNQTNQFFVDTGMLFRPSFGENLRERVSRGFSQVRIREGVKPFFKLSSGEQPPGAQRQQGTGGTVGGAPIFEFPNIHLYPPPEVEIVIEEAPPPEPPGTIEPPLFPELPPPEGAPVPPSPPEPPQYPPEASPGPGSGGGGGPGSGSGSSSSSSSAAPYVCTPAVSECVPDIGTPLDSADLIVGNPITVTYTYDVNGTRSALNNDGAVLWRNSYSGTLRVVGSVGEGKDPCGDSDNTSNVEVSGEITETYQTFGDDEFDPCDAYIYSRTWKPISGSVRVDWGTSASPNNMEVNGEVDFEVDSGESVIDPPGCPFPAPPLSIYPSDGSATKVRTLFLSSCSGGGVSVGPLGLYRVNIVQRIDDRIIERHELEVSGLTR